MRVYYDPSFLIALYLTEPLSPGARAFVQQQGQPILLNDLHEFEFRNGRQKVVRHEISEAEFERHMERRPLEEMDPEALETFRNGWCHGSEAFRKACLEKVKDNHPGRERLETAAAKAQRLIAQELLRLNWTHEDLIHRAKSDPLKLALAARLRRETTLSITQIADQLYLGKPKGAKSNLHRYMNGQPDHISQHKLDI